MFTEEFRKACEGCQSEEELKVVIDLHKSELTDEELQQVAGGIIGFAKTPLTEEEKMLIKCKYQNLYVNLAQSG